MNGGLALDYPSIVSLVIFIAAYILFVAFPKIRTWVAVGGAALLLILQALSLENALLSAINWNVMGIFVGTLFVADVFIESRVPAFIAEAIVRRLPTVQLAILFICFLTGVISAFVENVATVLIVAPIALALADKLKFNPVRMMIGIAISSNLQGAATLIGDPPSMLMAGAAKMNFMDFFFFQGKPSIFFAVEIGMIFSMFVLWFFFRREKHKMPEVSVEKVKSWFPTVILVLLIIALASSSFFDTGFSFAAGIICMLAGIVCLVWRMLISRWKGDGTETRRHRFFMNLHHRFDVAWKTVKTLDWETTLFLIGVFVLVGSLTVNGWDNRIAAWIAGLVGGNVLGAFIMLIGMSVLLSAFIDNVPYLAAMLPVVMDLSGHMNVEPALLLFGLLIGASLGGNVTPIGASANIVACGLLKKRGQTVGFGTFMKMGLPFTFVATVTASVFIWFVWGPK